MMRIFVISAPIGRLRAKALNGNARGQSDEPWMTAAWT